MEVREVTGSYKGTMVKWYNGEEVTQRFLQEVRLKL